MTTSTGTVSGRPGTAPSTATRERSAQAGNRVRAGVLALVLLAILIAGAAWSLSIGSQDIGLNRLANAVFDPQTTADLILRTIRLPRVVMGILIGACLAVAGAVMQAITANPLAAPEIMGVNAGAVLVVVLGITVVPSLAGAPSILLAFVGAAAAGVGVMLLARSGSGRTNPVRLALAGVTATSLLISITQVLIIFNENSTDSVLFWLVGGINFGTWHDIRTVLPWLVVGLIGAFWLAPSLNLLALGDDMARGLGQNVERIRIYGAGVVIVLCGAAVSVAGPVAFVGLIIPHIIRRITGSSYVLLLPLSALGGAVLLTYADIASRYINQPFEEPAGVVTAIIGAPIFVYLARRQKATR